MDRLDAPEVARRFGWRRVVVFGVALLMAMALIAATLTYAVGLPVSPAAPSVPALTLPIQIKAAGDLSCYPSTVTDSTCRMAEVAPLADGADLVLFLGDIAQNHGGADEYTQGFAPVWGRFLERALPVPGNHDYEMAGAAAYYAYFGDRAGDPRFGFYQIDLPGWRIYALNSNCESIGGCGVDSPQWRWLQAALRNDPGCSLAMFHHPLRSSVRWDTAIFSAPSAAPLYDLLIEAGVPLILAGHAHQYERIALNAQTEQIVVGTGGYGHHRLAPVGERDPGSQAAYNDTFGMLDLVLERGGYSSAFVTIGGERRDQIQRDCGTR